jgi:hypothetical protein
MATREELKERVASGVANVLDKHHPDWEVGVNERRNELNCLSKEHDVLSLSKADGQSSVGLGEEECVRYGFISERFENAFDMLKQAKQLRDIWLKLVDEHLEIRRKQVAE